MPYLVNTCKPSVRVVIELHPQVPQSSTSIEAAVRCAIQETSPPEVLKYITVCIKPHWAVQCVFFFFNILKCTTGWLVLTVSSSLSLQTCITLSLLRLCATSSIFLARPRFARVSCWGGCLRWWGPIPLFICVSAANFRLFFFCFCYQ